jgi:preprotein translocase subunit YajC
MGILLTETTAATEVLGNNGEQTLGSGFSIIIVYALLIFALWFFMFRPQKKEQKRVATMLSELAVGDCILTTSGFYGVVIDIDDSDNTVIVEFGNNKNCRIPMEKSAISKVEKA